MHDAAEFEAVLDRTYDALRKADYAALADLATATGAALDALRQADADTLRRCKAKALRNADCLQASLKGVRAARRRIEEVLGAERRLVTYGQGGKRETVALSPASLTQRL